MKRFKAYRAPHASSITRKDTDPIVQNGLAITPAQMIELTSQGMAISNQNAAIMRELNYSDAKGFDVPLEFRRHIDILADGYIAQQEMRSKFKNAVEGSDAFAGQSLQPDKSA